jgi:LDH2 family malate/lactate/ureidoglycolate dehydrogenase
MKSTPPFDEEKPVLIPGEIEAQTYADRKLQGIPMQSEELAALEALAKGQAPAEVAHY